MNGCQGGPPNGKWEAPPNACARREITRRLHRSRAFGTPSFASRDAANTGHIAGPALPTSTSVAAASPSGNGGTASSAATWNAPRFASPSASTVARIALKTFMIGASWISERVTRSRGRRRTSNLQRRLPRTPNNVRKLQSIEQSTVLLLPLSGDEEAWQVVSGDAAGRAAPIGIERLLEESQDLLTPGHVAG